MSSAAKIEEREGSNPCKNISAVSRVFPSVVRITSYASSPCRADNYFLFKNTCNGTIFSCIPDDHNAPFVSYILTCSSLFDQEMEHDIIDSPVNKINVRLSTGKLYQGEVMACDMEIMIAVIKIMFQSPSPTKLLPGDEVTVVSCGKSIHPLVFYGMHSVDYILPEYCIEPPFLKIHCGETGPLMRGGWRDYLPRPLNYFGPEIINGAPAINCEGDVIGVASGQIRDCAVLFPVNIFFKWWKQVLKYGEIRRPWMGIQIANLYTADLSYLEPIVLDCNVSDGVIVEKVICGSPASSANMQCMDVIYQCDGRPVRSFLEFTELLWDKSGEVIEAKGVRDGCLFEWKVEIKAIKTEILPDSIADYVVGKDIKTGILPESLAEDVVTKDINTGILPEALTENVVTSKKSTKRGNKKANDKKKSRKDKTKRKREGKTGSTNAEVDSVAVGNLVERKKRR